MKKLLLLLSLMLILPGYHQTATIETVSGTTSAQVYPAWYLSLCQSAVKDDSLTQDEFLQAFPDAAVRETIQGSYALVLADDSTQGFAFFNEKDALWNFIRVDRFKTKAEFEQHVTVGMPERDVRAYTSAVSPSPYSVFPEDAFLVQEGVFIVRYSTKDFTVETLFWVSNEELLSDDGWLLNYIPYIDPEDKIIGFAQ